MSGSWEKMGDNLEVAKQKLYDCIETLATLGVQESEDVIQKLYNVINILEVSYPQDYEDAYDAEEEPN